MRVGKKEYYKTKFKIAAIVPSVIMFFSLLLKFLLCIIFFIAEVRSEAWRNTIMI